MYLCYDIRGIQAFVFQIPRLKHIIGGSALIDRFDRKTVPELAVKHNWTRICSGGGKGAFACTDEDQAAAIREALIEQAHTFGADIRFGQHREYSEAAHCADQLYPYLPANLKGHPCPESGLYPVENEAIHPVVRRRLRSDSQKMKRWFEQRILKPEKLQWAPWLPIDKLAFFHDVDEGTAGNCALGRRNRWAVICMDGNDMGNQFRKMADASPSEPELLTWIKEVGQALDSCSSEACQAGIDYVMRHWAGDEKVRKQLEKGELTDDDEIVLPIRPLVVGGDDITVLCHSAYAATFVKEVCRAFEAHSQSYAEAARTKGIKALWPATDGRVTISAGILYCGTSLPLASAIPYAESLLAMAKGKGRVLGPENGNGPSPACVDFEVTTESLIDHPATRRKRQQLAFLDKDIQEEVELTARPYTIADFSELLSFDVFKSENGGFLPGTILHELQSALNAAYNDRAVYRHRLGKHQKRLAAALAETADGPFPDGSHWKRVGSAGNANARRHTDVLDMALLFQEGRRMEKETV